MDPVDYGLIINEQAINISTNHTKLGRKTILDIDSLKEQILEKPKKEYGPLVIIKEKSPMTERDTFGLEIQSSLAK